MSLIFLREWALDWGEGVRGGGGGGDKPGRAVVSLETAQTFTKPPSFPTILPRPPQTIPYTSKKLLDFNETDAQ
jgi:hypothetical protein